MWCVSFWHITDALRIWDLLPDFSDLETPWTGRHSWYAAVKQQASGLLVLVFALVKHSTVLWVVRHWGMLQFDCAARALRCFVAGSYCFP